MTRFWDKVSLFYNINYLIWYLGIIFIIIRIIQGVRIFFFLRSILVASVKLYIVATLLLSSSLCNIIYIYLRTYYLLLVHYHNSTQLCQYYLQSSQHVDVEFFMIHQSLFASFCASSFGLNMIFAILTSKVIFLSILMNNS